MAMAREKVMERFGQLSEHDRSFDIAYWQGQDAQARINATWELIVHASRAKGMDVRQLRLQRSVEHFQRQKRALPGGGRIRRGAVR